MATTTAVEAYPLYWPEGRPRTPSYRMQRSRFETGFGSALNFLREEERRGAPDLHASHFATCAQAAQWRKS